MSKFSEVKEILGEDHIINVTKSGRSLSIHVDFYGIGSSLLSDLIERGLIDMEIKKGTLKFNFYLGGRF